MDSRRRSPNCIPHDVLWRMVESDGTQVVGHVAEVLVQSPFDLSARLAAPAVIEQNPRYSRPICSAWALPTKSAVAVPGCSIVSTIAMPGVRWCRSLL
jgi:hypothetical protein